MDEDDGPGLEDLGRQFAELIGQDPYQPAPPPLSGLQEQDDPQWAPELAEDDSPVTPRGILEALLFVGNPDNAPLSGRKVASLMRGVSPREIDELVQQLNQDYEVQGAAYRIVSQEGGYRMQLTDDLAGLARRAARKSRAVALSPQAIEVLALVAYEQPITRAEIDHRRGAQSGGLLSQLVRRRLLVWSREEKVVRYRTSEEFLHWLGLDSLDQLPET